MKSETRLNKRIKESLKKASLVMQLENDSLKINSTFSLFNRFNFGMVVILVFSLLLIAISIYKATEITLVFLVLFGLLLMIVSVASILKQFTDFLLVTDKEIVFRNSLQKKIFPITPDLKVKTSVKRKFTLRASSVQGSYSREVDIFIKKDKIKYRILDFIMEDESSEETKYLSKAIARFIKSKIKNSGDEKS